MAGSGCLGTAHRRQHVDRPPPDACGARTPGRLPVVSLTSATCRLAWGPRRCESSSGAGRARAAATSGPATCCAPRLQQGRRQCGQHTGGCGGCDASAWHGMARPGLSSCGRRRQAGAGRPARLPPAVDPAQRPRPASMAAPADVPSSNAGILLAGAQAALVRVPNVKHMCRRKTAPGPPGPPPTLPSSLPIASNTKSAADSAAGPTQASARRPRVFPRPGLPCSRGDPRATMAMEARSDRCN